tara:strand:- start:10274 stop:10900 length:627 start_codon:yes stop_codon:yes gene_type:complete
MSRADRPFIPTTVIDNFFETPSLWRNFALQQEYYKGDRGTWPGIRTPMLHELSQELYDILEIRLLEHLPTFKGFSKIDSTFQIIDETWGKGWVHDDNPEHDVAGIIYLNETSPLNSGTTMYSGAADINGDYYSKLFMEDVLSVDPEERKTYAKYRDEQRSFFTPVTNVDFEWNRCVMFDPRTWHSADNFFGKTLDDSRLTLVFFGNAL